MWFSHEVGICARTTLPAAWLASRAPPFKQETGGGRAGGKVSGGGCGGAWLRFSGATQGSQPAKTSWGGVRPGTTRSNSAPIRHAGARFPLAYMPEYGGWPAVTDSALPQPSCAVTLHDPERGEPRPRGAGLHTCVCTRQRSATGPPGVQLRTYATHLA